VIRFVCASMVACLSFAATVHADDWPQFRGPTGQGSAAGRLPTEWGPKKNVAWKKAIPGLGWSSPVIAKGKIYLTTSVGGTKGSKELSLRALCLDAATGNILWNNEVFAQKGAIIGIHSKNSHASPTPIFDGDRIIVHFGHQGTAALDLDGKILWKNNNLKYEPVHGNGGTPIIVDSNVVFSSDGGDIQFLVALDRATGDVVWKSDRNPASSSKFAFSTPLLIEVGDRPQIISPCAGYVAGYESKKGDEIWRVDYGEGYSNVPRPVFAHGLLYVSSGYNSPILYAIRPGGQGDVTKTHVAWMLKKGAPLTPSPVIHGDELYVIADNGLASCVDAKTGKIHWQERIAGSYSASPLVADGKIYFLSEDGAGTVIKAAKEFELIARNELAEKTLASYAASDGALYIRTEKNLYRIQEP
jgi:outer membrane protein assembly factor BamB